MREYERLGYRAVWMPESLGSKEVFAHASILLGGSERAIVAPGIASIYARDPMAMANGAKAVAEAFPGRFVLGIGVSHAPSVAMRGGSYGKPVETMTAYLDGMAAASYAGPEPGEPVPLVLAALGPKMLELAATRTDGAHPYFVPVEHTPIARAALGPEPCLAVEMTAVPSTDADDARRIGRAFAKHYLALPNYANNLRRLGWSDEDIANEGSDALIDAVIAWGDVDAIVARVKAHLDGERTTSASSFVPSRRPTRRSPATRSSRQRCSLSERNASPTSSTTGSSATSSALNQPNASVDPPTSTRSSPPTTAIG